MVAENSPVMKRKMLKVTSVFMLICFQVSVSEESCLSFGHSCWGGHGKRSDGSLENLRPIPAWFMSRLIPKYNIYDTRQDVGLDVDLDSNADRNERRERLENLDRASIYKKLNKDNMMKVWPDDIN